MRLRSVCRVTAPRVALAAFVAVSLLAGCALTPGATGDGSRSGRAGAGGGVTPNVTPSVTPTRTPQVAPGGSTSDAPLPCTGSRVPGAPAPVVTLRGADGVHEVSAPVGSVVEIRLDGKYQWTRMMVDPADALAPVGAQGALEQGDCVWDFQVARVGLATVTVTGGQLCYPNEPCLQYALVAIFTIHGI